MVRLRDLSVLIAVERRDLTDTGLGTGCARVADVVTLFGYAREEQGGPRMATANIKEEARKLIEEMPDGSTWDDLMREIYVRQAIESGLADSEAGRTTSVETLRAGYGLEK
jgi:hypothetical protein